MLFCAIPYCNSPELNSINNYIYKTNCNECFTREGIHFNMRGKSVICDLCDHINNNHDHFIKDFVLIDINTNNTSNKPTDSPSVKVTRNTQDKAAANPQNQFVDATALL
ncbi:hypothetical protein FQA39_LY02224 [Lamprigera yunnana]|nr:hypothetical protein FQA39_LY02224 [Lamprigera yunnana]